MPSGGFFGGFAQGFSQSFGRAQEQRRLRDVLQFQREQQAAQDRRADRGLELREQEALDLRNYRQQTAERQQQLLDIQKRSAAIQQEMQLRQMDQAVLGSLEKVFDPRVPAELRSLILKQNAPHIGIDPKSQQFQDFTKAITKLDSDSLSALSTAIQVMVPTMEPGQITALSKGVLSGQVTIDQVMDMAKQRAAAMREEQERLLLERELGGTPSGSTAATNQALPRQDGVPPTQSRTQGSGAVAETQVDLGGAEAPSSPGIPIPGYADLPPAKANAVRRDMMKAIPDIENTTTEQMTPDMLRKSAVVFMRHNMREAASFARLLAQDLEEAGSGTFLQVDPKTGQVIFSQGGKGAAGKFSEQQSKDLVFATRAKGALKNLDPIDEELTSFTGRAAELDPTGIARFTQSPEFQKAMQAGDEFLQAILRKDTGAAITEQEQRLYGRTYIPQIGDSAALLKQKKEARGRAIIALEAGMSPEQILSLEQAELREERQQEEPQGGNGFEETDIPGVRIRRKQ